MHLLRQFFHMIFWFVIVVSALGGCAQNSSRVSVDIETCCDAPFERYATYQVRMSDIPGFLQPYLRGGLASVLNRKGLTETLDRPDAVVSLMFNQVFLTPEAEPHDYFGEGVDSGIATHFMAAIEVDMIDTRSNRMLWSGRLSRIHYDPHGQPRGNDHKMQGIIDGFDALFAEYPIRLRDKVEQQ